MHFLLDKHTLPSFYFIIITNFLMDYNKLFNRQLFFICLQIYSRITNCLLMNKPGVDCRLYSRGIGVII